MSVTTTAVSANSGFIRLPAIPVPCPLTWNVSSCRS